MSAIRHIVLFKFYDVIDDESRMYAIDKLRSLEDLPGIVEWRLEASTDRRKGLVVVQNVLFESEQAFDTYRESAEHKDIGTTLSALADWLVADYPE